MVFSISTIRSDGLIVRTDGIEVVSLPDATPDAAARQAREFLEAIVDDGDLAGVLVAAAPNADGAPALPGA